MLKKLILINALALGAISMPITTVATHASPQIFKNMTGKWRGKGLVKVSLKGKTESIRCRMNNKPDGSEKIKLGGNCVIGGFVFSLRGFIQQEGKKNAYTASLFKSLTTLKQNKFTGKRNGRKINFTFKARDRLSKQDVTAKINLNSKSEKAFAVDISSSDPKSGKVYKVGTITFTKK